MQTSCDPSDGTPSKPLPRDKGAAPVSCFIIAHNEAERIAATIRAILPHVAEVLVVDSGSTDGTPDICRALGARVVSNAWEGFGPQKRFAENACTHDWVLNLDADEVVTTDLAEEIVALFRHGPPDHPFFRFKVVTVYPGSAGPRLWADWYNVLRLYDRRAGGFRDSLVHDSVVALASDGPDRPARQLNGIVHHHCYLSLEHLAKKQDRYTDLQSREIRKPAIYLLLRLLIEFPLSFFKYYVLRRQFTGGRFGFGVARVLATYRTVRIWRLLRAAGKDRSG